MANKVQREVKGRGSLHREFERGKPQLVRARRLKGRWVGAAITLPREAIVDAIRRDRESRW